MNFNKKQLIFISVFGVALQANAIPLTENTAEQFYKYNDFDNMIKLKEIEQQKYTSYALNKVDMQLQEKVVPDQIRVQAAKEIEVVYKKFVESKINQIQLDAIQHYKNEFFQTQTEESVKHQLNFYQSGLGKKIYEKQSARRAAIQNLQKILPLTLASQPQLQASFNQALQGVH